MNQSDKYAIFVDYSGSTGGCHSYWNTVQLLLDQYAKDIDHYYLWDSRCNPSSKKEYEEFIAKRRGMGGTSPQSVATVITEKKYKNIILMTDGEVGDHSVTRCDKIFEEAKAKHNYKIEKAIVYVVGGYHEPNLSVTCPFTRFSESKVFSRLGDNPLKEVMSYTAEDYKILDSLEDITLENFEAQYQKIEQLIIAQNMGKDGNLPLKNQLMAMKTKLIKELSKKLGKKDFSVQLRTKLEDQDLKGSLEMIKSLAEKYFEANNSNELQTKINYLISLCGDMRGQYNLGQIKSNKMATAQTAVQGQLDKNQDLNDLSKNPIECPIIMDQDVPQILVDECEPFLLGVEKCIVDDINACPLRLLNYPDLKAKFKARLSTYTGTKYCDKLLKNPFTQNRLLGSIPLGTHKSHMTVGNHTIAKMVAGGKVMGNLNMYFAVIWIIVNEDEVEFLTPIKANLAEHMIFRLKNTKTMASMCGLSQFVSTQVDTDIALWYCANSGYLNNTVEKDTFRFHLYNMEAMTKLIKLLGYPMDAGFERHYQRTLALHYLLDRFKRCSPSQRKAMRTLFVGLYQKGFFVDTSKLEKRFRQNEVCPDFIPVDGPADEVQVKAIRSLLPVSCRHMQVEDILYVYSLLDEHKQVSEIFLDYNVVVPEIPEAEINWKYGLENYEHSVKICPETGRPLSMDNDKSWSKNAKEVFGFSSNKQLFKGCKYMEEFIMKYKKQPTRHELAIFYYNRYVEADSKNKKNTLPHQTEQWINQLLKSYEAVFAEGHDIKQIIANLKASRELEKRVEMEVQ